MYLMSADLSLMMRAASPGCVCEGAGGRIYAATGRRGKAANALDNPESCWWEVLCWEGPADH